MQTLEQRYLKSLKKYQPLANFIANLEKMSKKNTNTGQVFHFDLYGKREGKYQFLHQNSLYSVPWTVLTPDAPNFFLVKKDYSVQSKYDEGIKVDQLFIISSSGIKTHRDDFVIDFDRHDLGERIAYFFDSKHTNEQVRVKFRLKDNRDWSMDEARKDNYFKPEVKRLICYRPFDIRFIYYDKKLIDFGREKTLFHLLDENNLGLVLVQQPQAANINFFDCCIISKNITDTNLFRRGGPFVFPLYLFSETNNQFELEETKRIPNLKIEFIQQIAQKIGLQFTNEKEKDSATFAPIDLLDYIYAVLHSPTYRETYKEFLKIDFPRVPYPKDAATFWALVALGGQLRQIHLLESPAVQKYVTQYPEDGDNVVKKIRYEVGNVFINERQYFANVPLVAWEFYIGGYQPAQKWLKDRKDRELGYEDILHYQKIIVALVETNRLMKEVDKIEVV